jgi:hypothetical protein
LKLLFKELNVPIRDKKKMIKKIALVHDVDRVFSFKNTVAKN